VKLVHLVGFITKKFVFFLTFCDRLRLHASRIGECSSDGFMVWKLQI